MLGSLLFIVAPANRVTTAPFPSTSQTVSPTPVPTPDEKKPNPVRRFFSWVGGLVTRPFRKREHQIVDPPAVRITASPDLIMGCRSFPSEPCSGEREVELYATANSPVGDKLVFTWAVTGGRLRGEGRKVTWDISGLREGTYTAMVDVNYARHRTVSDSTVIRILPCALCDPPPCPTISVACPSRADSKQLIVFEATASGGSSELNLTYTWSVTAGKIISGQGTTKITVDAANLAGQSITATVTVGGMNPNCSGNTASCTVIDVTGQPSPH